MPSYPVPMISGLPVPRHPECMGAAPSSGDDSSSSSGSVLQSLSGKCAEILLKFGVLGKLRCKPLNCHLTAELRQLYSRWHGDCAGDHAVCTHTRRRSPPLKRRRTASKCPRTGTSTGGGPDESCSLDLTLATRVDREVWLARAVTIH